jgi:DUF2924 family protein
VEGDRTPAAGNGHATASQVFGTVWETVALQSQTVPVSPRRLASKALEYGELSEQARQRALALAQDVELRIKAPGQLLGTAQQMFVPTIKNRRPTGRDQRLPEPGRLLQREFKGQMVEVQVLEDGFQYQDRFYKSLSAIARQVTGTHWNGYAFFRVRERSDGGSQ